MPDDEPPCLSAALAYAARGWPTFPLKPCSKEPITRHAVKDATLDDVQLRRWFHRWPDANVGLACGAPGPQALDIDDLEAGRGVLATVSELGGPDVATARGRQFYLQGSSSSTISLGYGELRGVGSYVVAPPSIHPTGKVYTFLVEPSDLPLPTVPAGLVPAGTSTAGAGEMNAGPLIGFGQRHDALKDAAVRLVRSGITDAETLELMLRSFFAARCEPHPKPRKGEFAQIAKWATRSEIAQRERAFGEPVEGKVKESAPGADATLGEHRAFLRRMGGWPAGVDVELVRRKGGRLVDGLEITLTNGLTIRFTRQDQITTRGHWHRAVIGATNGIANPPGLKETQLFAVYRSLCVLADAPSEDHGDDAELVDAIADFLGMAEAMTEHDLGDPADRYDVIARCRVRPPFDPYRLDDHAPALIVDKDGKRYMRAGELQSYLLRKSTDLSTAQIPGRLEALGLERVALHGRERGVEDDRRRRTNHMIVYRIPWA